MENVMIIKVEEVLTENDIKALRKTQKYLKLQKTKWGKNILATQKFWQGFVPFIPK